MNLNYHIVDVFTNQQFGGNPLAVVPDGRGISDELMQQIAKEFNLSETTFVLPPQSEENDFHVRIFTPSRELPMAGHPTVGTAFILAREGLIKSTQTKVIFEEGVGPIPVELEFRGGQPYMMTMDQPLPEFGPELEDRASVAEMLSIAESDLHPDLPAQVVSCCVPIILIPIRNLDVMKRLELRQDVWKNHYAQYDASLYMLTTETELPDSAVHGRMFGPNVGIPEDPATGAAHGPLGSYLVKYGVVQGEAAQHMVSEQGFEMGRPSYIHMSVEGDSNNITRVRVGGESAYMGQGQLQL